MSDVLFDDREAVRRASNDSVGRTASARRGIIAVPGTRTRGASPIPVQRDAPGIAWWTMRFAGDDLVLDGYLGSYSLHNGSQDAFAARRLDDRLTLAVADGCTPTRLTPTNMDGRLVRGDVSWADAQHEPGPLDGAQFAARLAMLSVAGRRRDTDAVACFNDINQALLRHVGPPLCTEHGLGDPLHLDDVVVGAHGESPHRHRPQTGVVMVDLALSGSSSGRIDAYVTRAADCDVWLRRAGRWSLQTPQDMLKPHVRAGLDHWHARRPGASVFDRLRFEQRLGLDDQSSWCSTVLGRFQRPTIESLTVEVDESVTDLLLVTDGAHLREANWRDPDPHSWMLGLRDWEKTHLPRTRQHADVAMLWLHRPDGRPLYEAAAMSYLKT